MIDEDTMAEEEVRINGEIKFLTLFEHSTDGLALFEKPDTPLERLILIMCNDSYVKMAGRSREELMDAQIEELFKPLSGRDLSDIDEQDETEQLYSWTRPDGKENFIASRSVPVVLGDGHYLYTINHDITIQRQTNEKLRQERCAVENAGTGILILDTRFHITYANPATVEMFNYGTSKELLGKPARCLWGDAEECQHLLEKVSQTGKTTRIETSMIKKGDIHFDGEISLVCNTDTDGLQKGIVLSVVDISDRKQAQMHQAMIASLGAACHHLGQPTQVLMGNLAVLKMSHKGNPELIDACEEAVDNIAQLLHKFNSISAYETVPYVQGGESCNDEILKI